MSPSCALLDGFAIGARVALLWQHCGNAWQSPAVIRQAQRTPHARYACRRRLPSPAINRRACCVRRSISSILRGVVTRTRNVSEYMLVLALCVVVIVNQMMVTSLEECFAFEWLSVAWQCVSLSSGDGRFFNTNILQVVYRKVRV